ncbi:hypothetical protein H0H81_004549 [Sphagnurus paluster]|uniref:DUF4470 domain-containing protein n=1 Tax=Sphagnurus paluster TaxID=117069 RepID=A0A9P7K618_9AGAR|nr:hypothetical protein H0H81_004549 [Sphagnurus paluster]
MSSVKRAVEEKEKGNKLFRDGQIDGAIDATYASEKASEIEAIESLSRSGDSQIAETWTQWRNVQLNHHFNELAHKAKVRFSHMPISKGTPDQSMTFFNIDLISLFDGWDKDDPSPVNIQTFAKNGSLPLAFLFGGAGDARHVFGTILGLTRAHKKLRPVEKKALKTHITVLDIHFATVARDLVLFWLLNKLVEEKLDAISRLEIQAALPIVRALNYWSTNTSITASGLISHHSHRSPIEHIKAMSGGPFGMFGDPLAGRRQDAAAADRMGPLELRRVGEAFGLGSVPLAKVREVIQKNKVESMVLADFDKNTPWRLEHEAEWYTRVKVFVPLSKMWHLHPGLEYYGQIRGENVSESTMRKIARDVQKSWKPNITLLDGTKDGYPSFDYDVFTIVHQIAEFSKNTGLNLKVDKTSPSFSYVATFFENVAGAIKILLETIKVEFICGEVNKEISKIRHLLLERLTIKNMSSRDYTNGTLNTAIYTLPVLQDIPDSAVSANCLYLGIRELNGKAVIERLKLTKSPLPRPLSALASCENLRDWLAGLFIATVSPGTFQQRPHFVKLPNTLVVFVALLIELRDIGYPSHWLAEYLQVLLSGALITDRLAYRNQIPRPISDLRKRGDQHRLRIDPWLSDLEAILASSRGGLPFALQMPVGLDTKADDIGHYKASISANMFYSSPIVRFPENDAVLSLLFYRDAKEFHPKISKTAGTLDWFLQEIPDIVDGRVTPTPGTFHIITGPDYIDLAKGEVAWRMSKTTIARMRKENWVMVAWRADFWVDSTSQYSLTYCGKVS